MEPTHLNLIRDINRLWEPVYPYLSEHILELYHRRDGDILEIGPFSGVIFDLQKKHIGNSFSIASFPTGMGNFFYEEARKQKVEDRIRVIETDPTLSGIEETSIDLAIFRGAFFFPSLFKVNFPAMDRVLKPNGIGLIGGGFGKFTPDHVIKEIGKRSRDLNLQIGKIEIDEERLRREIESEGVKGGREVITEGGLWVVIRKDVPMPGLQH
jgi:hypothetical protein